VSYPPFTNEPVLELRRAPQRESLTRALAELDTRLPLTVPVVVGGERSGSPSFQSSDPGKPSRVVAELAAASEADVDAAVETVTHGGRLWARTPASERAAILVRAAAGLRERRLELAALAVRECGKPWAEADGDVCEAIDFLEYYARGALELDRPPQLIQVPGEQNTMRYFPRGVLAVISPWNFPLAIPLGMVAAGLATGNGVVLKPAEQSPACGLALVDVLHRAGVPPDALALLPGLGEVGAALVRHRGVHTVAFTGSGAVGLEIVRTAAQTPDDQGHVKRVIAEMGGKNCIIVDSDADLDDAVPAIAGSAFDYAGQKCSAAARVLVHEHQHDALVRRLTGVVEVLEVGQAERFSTDVGPVVEREAKERIEGFLADVEQQGRIAAAATAPEGEGWFCPATVACDLDLDARVLHEEVFGPLLAVQSVPSVEAACEIVEAQPVALTGGLFTRNPAVVDAVVERLPVGNLYINRPITGAMVGRQPFGGNRRSGIGAKAGGPDYLIQFTESRAVSENTVRHGLVVE